MSTHHIFLPHSSAKLRALNRASINPSIYGRGTGTVLLDGGIGGQSSYPSIESYMETTGRDPYNNKMTRSQAVPAFKSGSGLADKIASKLSKLSLDKPNKPKKKNIVMSF
jgi:hypothetical protein